MERAILSQFSAVAPASAPGGRASSTGAVAWEALDGKETDFGPQHFLGRAMSCHPLIFLVEVCSDLVRIAVPEHEPAFRPVSFHEAFEARLGL